MSVTIANGTKDIVVSWYNDKGVVNIETLTIPPTGEYGSHTITIPATAAAAQGDYIVITSVGLEDSAAVWFDIDAAGTEPTGIFYTNVTEHIEVNIVTGGTAIQNAAAFVLAVEAVTEFTGITLTDNLDGTITIEQDAVGWAGDFLTKNADDSTDGSIVAVTDAEGVLGIVQGDYVVVENAYGIPLGIWFDVDEDGTSPSGDAFITAAGDGATLMISVSTGDSAIDNAANVVAAVSVLDWANPMVVLDSLDGTIKLTQLVGGVVSAADPHNINDTSVGSITATTNQVGALGLARLIDSIPKDGLRVIENFRDNEIYLISSAGTNNSPKGNGYVTLKFEEVTSPVTANLVALKAQIDTWATPAVIDPSDYGVCDGEYDATLSDTVDLASIGWIQPTLLAGTIKYTTVDGEVRTRAFEQNEVSLFRVKRVWETGTTPDMGIVVIH